MRATRARHSSAFISVQRFPAASRRSQLACRGPSVPKLAHIGHEASRTRSSGFPPADAAMSAGYEPSSIRPFDGGGPLITSTTR